MQNDSKEVDRLRQIGGLIRKVDIKDGVIDSRELFQSGRELQILHGSQTYRLRLTGLNKLILTK